tara:strand:- start:285 stop:446 length:162 start_codon:yes stop_codon:yes gene_type:complete
LEPQALTDATPVNLALDRREAAIIVAEHHASRAQQRKVQAKLDESLARLVESM